MEKILSLAKNRGFVFQGSEIYGGLANTWDYGPLGWIRCCYLYESAYLGSIRARWKLF